MPSDWKIQHINVDVDTTGKTLSAPTDFVAVGSTAKAFLLSGNSARSSGGGTGVVEEAEDLGIQVYFTAVDSISIDRATATGTPSQTVSFMIVEYTGDAGGQYEFKVRHRGNTQIPQGTSGGSETLDSTPADIKDCIPFFFASSAKVSNGGIDFPAIFWCSGTETLNYIRGGQETTGVNHRVEVVEFTGSEFSVGHGDSGLTDADDGTITLKDGADGTGNTFDVVDWSNAIIHHTHKGDPFESHSRTANISCTYFPTAGETTQVDWHFEAGHISAGTQDRHFLHVLLCSDMNVTRYFNTDLAKNAVNIDVTSAGLSSLDESFVMFSSMSGGTGTAYPRGWKNARLTSITNVEQYTSLGGLANQQRIEVVDVSAFEGVSLVTGTLEQSLGTVTSDGEGSTLVTGTLEQSLGNLVLTSIGFVEIQSNLPPLVVGDPKYGLSVANAGGIARANSATPQVTCNTVLT